MLYLIKRGPKPPWHRAPFHPVIICDRKRIAKVQAGNSADFAWVWTKANEAYTGWFIERWNGLDIDYYPVAVSFTLPDGLHAGVFHDRNADEPWVILDGAVWWSEKRIPPWLEAKGVRYIPDRHSRQRMLDEVADDCHSGFGERIEPSFWPAAEPLDQAALS